MTAFDVGDIVVAEFPFVDVPLRKPRPVLVLSTATFQKGHAHFLGAMITTGAQSTWPSDHAIHDLDPTGLGHASVVRMKLFTLPVSEAKRSIGRLASDDLQAVRRAFATMTGIETTP